MKKYLLTSAAALAFCGLFTSCTHDLGYDESSAQNSVMKTYEQAFVTAFGQPDPNQEWGFGASVATSRAMTRSLGNYDNYKGSLQPFVWGNDPNDNNQWKQMPYTFPSAPADNLFASSKDNNAVLITKYENGNNFYIDNSINGNGQTIQPNGNNVKLYVTGDNVIPTGFYIPGGTTLYLLPNTKLTLPNNFSFGQWQCNIYVAEGAELICSGKLQLAANCGLYNKGTITTDQLEVTNSAIFYNQGTIDLSNKNNGEISVENNNSVIVNDGTLNAKNLLTKGSGRVQNNAELTISNTTTINSNGNVWVNNGYYKTKYFEYTATSSSVINNCFLEVTEDFFMNISDGSGDFKIDAGGGVLTKNFYGGGVYGGYNGGPYKITMGSRSVFKVTNEAHLNATASGIATNHYGFEGVGEAYAVFQAKKVSKDGKGHGNVAYTGNIYVSSEEHFAQETEGYADGSSAIIFANGSSEANIYAPGFQSGTPDITIPTTPCNPGFGEPGPDPDAIRVICEDLSVTQASDWDFNDVVFDVKLVENNSKVQITLRAAGGTLLLTVAGKEVHELFKEKNPTFDITSGTMVSTGTTNSTGKYRYTKLDGIEAPVFTIDNNYETDNVKEIAKKIPVQVYKLVNDKKDWYDIEWKKGAPTAKIGVGTDYNWCDETVDIRNWFTASSATTSGDTYSTFQMYVDGDLTESEGENAWYNVKVIE